MSSKRSLGLRQVKSLHYATVKEDQCRDLTVQGPYSAGTLQCRYLTVPGPYSAGTLRCRDLTVPRPYGAGTLQCRDLTVPFTKTFGLGLRTCQSKLQNLIFFNSIKFSSVILCCITFNWLIFIKMLFLHSQHLFRNFKRNNILLPMLILRGAWNVNLWLPNHLHYIISFILHWFFLWQFFQERNRVVNRGLPV
jgi:hypothetical protein